MTTSSQAIIAQIPALLRQGRGGEALSLLKSARQEDPEIQLHVALVLRTGGDLAGALAALDRALALDPYHFVALLSKGSVLEQMKRPKEAARAYGYALKIGPPDDRLPPSLRAVVAKARETSAAYRSALSAHLRAATEDLRGGSQNQEMRRFDESIDIVSGLRKVYVHEPTLLNYPGLPAIGFFDRAHFPWLERLEAATDVIREELVNILARQKDRFRPYIQFPPGSPVNQWVDLNHSPSWTSLHLWRDGRRDDDVCATCPNTAALLQSLPMADQPGFAPTAMFSVLAPRTRIPPHTGSTNVRSIVHLPLILPGGCAFRVANETRPWRMGEAWVFDDSIEHEAWNDSDEIRVVLIFDVWNPFVSLAERALITRMLNAMNAFEAG